ncbi:MAG: hypothetical protein QOG69_646 [Actinomycetota bacterium]|nr:hypothetical protein [Actinomycetota bacterium]
MVLTGVQPRMMRVLAITKLRRVLTIDRAMTVDRLPVNGLAVNGLAVNGLAADRMVTIDDELRVADGTVPDDHALIVLPDPAVCAG